MYVDVKYEFVYKEARVLGLYSTHYQSISSRGLNSMWSSMFSHVFDVIQALFPRSFTHGNFSRSGAKQIMTVGFNGSAIVGFRLNKSSDKALKRERCRVFKGMHLDRE